MGGTPAITSARRRALTTFTKFMRAHNALRQRLEPVLTELGVTPTQFGVLEALHHLGPMNQRDIGRKILTSKGNLSVVIHNLERDGMIERATAPHDRRQKMVALTGRGRRFVEWAFPIQAAAVERELGALNAGEQRELGRICRKLGAGIGEEGGL